MIRIVVFSLIAVVMIAVAVLGVRGCKSSNPPLQPFMDMVDQPRYDPQAASRFFADGRTQRPPPQHTVAWGRDPRAADAAHAQQDGELFRLDKIPVDMSRELLLRGQKGYQIFCTVCHGGTGAGNGITVQYGMNRPPSYHGERLRQLGDGQIFQTITVGKGQMGPYGNRIPRADRWAIVAYVRALQRAHKATADDVPRHIIQAQKAEEVTQ